MQSILTSRDSTAITTPITQLINTSANLAETSNHTDRFRFVLNNLLTAELDLTTDLTNTIAAVLTSAEILASLDTLTTGFTTSTTFAEVPTLDGKLTTAAQIIAADSAVGAALADTAQVVGLPIIGGTERFTSTDTASVVADLRLSLLETLVAADVFRQVADLSETETLALAESLRQAVRAELSSTAAVALTDALQHSVVFTIAESTALVDTATLTFATLLDLADGAAFIVNLPLEEGEFSAWVMNADTTGVTTYSNFPMLGLASFDGVPYGITETGLYRLEGDDDDGADIDAWIATGDMDFGTSRDKNVPRAYLYITQAGDAVLKTISQIRGSRHETYYELAARTTDGDDETLRRVPLGRGVRGVWWRFELHNVAGSDFELDGAEVRPVVLSRRG